MIFVVSVACKTALEPECTVCDVSSICLICLSWEYILVFMRKLLKGSYQRHLKRYYF